MKSYTTAEIRNVALIGAKGSGKTSLAEAMLFSAKMISRLGKVQDGNTALDFEPEEHKRVASVQAKAAWLEWKKHKVNVLDTPGDPIFTVEANNCIRVVDGLAVVVSATDGIEPQAQKLFNTGKGLAACVVINKLGRERADFQRTLAQVKERLTSSAVPVTLPIGQEDKFKGVVDLINMKAKLYNKESADQPKVEEIPADLKDEAQQARAALFEEIAGTNEKLMEKYLESGELSEDEAKAGLQAAVAAGTLVPVFAADGAWNVGTAEVLDFLVFGFPSPDKGRPVTMVNAQGEESELHRKADGDVVMLVFKTIVDQLSGKLTLARVFSGRVTKETAAQNVNRKASERLGNLQRIIGKKIETCDDAAMGDIVAVAKLKETLTGDTLVSGSQQLTVKLPAAPPPQISYRLIPRNKGDDDKIGQAIARLRDEDPTLVVGHDEITKELMLSGFGVAHIDVAIEKMERKYGVKVDRAVPNVPYRETVHKAVQNVEGKHKKQSGGRGQFGVCYINVKPLPRSSGYQFVNSIFGGSVPRQYIPAIDKGVQEAIARGIIAGYPVVDIEVELIDGKYHDVDSSEMAFKIAGSKGIQAAAKSAGMIILEPVMAVEIEVPEESMGDIMGDISSRRGRVLGMETQGGVSVVKAQVPMSEMLSYAPDLGSMTGGRGSFTMSQSHYDPVPAHLMDKIIANSPNKPAAAAEEE
ncbi:MAG: elongation factor G [Deltaproteobacteria bacterium]|nr:elongation factor G [Deltaproteobacteria bacterium]